VQPALLARADEVIDMIDRRVFAVAAIAGIAIPAVTRAQSIRTTGKIGILNKRGSATATVAIMRPVWQRLGYVEGETVLLRAAEGDAQRFPSLVTELSSQGVGALIVVGAEAVRAVNKATSALPIVAIDLETDPVRAGFAASIARPGGDVTGLFLDLPSLAGKWIELLQDLVPDIERIVLSWDPTTGRDELDVAMAAAKARGVQVEVFEAGTFDNFEPFLQRLMGPKRTGVIQLSSPGFSLVAPGFAAAAQKHQLPTVAFLKLYAQAGVLLTYGPIQEDYFPRAIIIADKILKGAKPADLPIEQPTKFELVINLKTAKALGLTIPSTLLARADEVIE